MSNGPNLEDCQDNRDLAQGFKQEVEQEVKHADDPELDEYGTKTVKQENDQFCSVSIKVDPNDFKQEPEDLPEYGKSVEITVKTEKYINLDYFISFC